MPATAIWLVIAIALIIGEVLTVGLTFLWFAVGAVAGLLVAWLHGPVWLQLVAAVLVSALALALVRPVAARFFSPKHTPTNADRILGSTALVTQGIDNGAEQGQVKIAGQVWTARSQQNVVIPAGREVKVLRIEGVKVIVEAI